MTPDQQGAARVGYGDQLLARIEANASPTSNKAKPLQSPKRVEEAQAMALQPDLLQRRLEREGAMWETQNKALGGSKTADNLSDIGDVNGTAAGIGGAARSAANFQLGDAAARLGGALGPIAKGQTEATRQMIAQMLLSADPQKALAPALRQQQNSETTRRLIEGLLRNPLRSVATQ